MGFRSTLISEDVKIDFPEWFREKYSGSLNIPIGYGCLSSKGEYKTYGAWTDLGKDIQKVVDWSKTERFSYIYFHECGGVTKVTIKKSSIAYMEPENWSKTESISHNYCYGCSD